MLVFTHKALPGKFQKYPGNCLLGLKCIPDPSTWGNTLETKQPAGSRVEGDEEQQEGGWSTGRSKQPD